MHLEQGCREDNKVWAITLGARAEISWISCDTFNIIVDVLGGSSRDVRKALKELVGNKSDTIALQM